MVSNPPFEISKNNINAINLYFTWLEVHKTIEHLCQVQTIIGFDSVINQMATVIDGAAHQSLIGFNQSTNRKSIIALPIVIHKVARSILAVFDIFSRLVTYT
jgi:hypothetical protein